MESTITAGRELDALVAEKVMGLDISKYPIHHEHSNYPESRSVEYWTEDIPHYSVDIAAAWEVVEKLETLHLQHGGKKYGMWQAEFCDQIGDNAVEAETAPLAICLAALKAVEKA